MGTTNEPERKFLPGLVKLRTTHEEAANSDLTRLAGGFLITPLTPGQPWGHTGQSSDWKRCRSPDSSARSRVIDDMVYNRPVHLPAHRKPGSFMSSNELVESAAHGENEHESAEGSPDRRGLLVAGIVLLACLGLVGYGMLDTDEQPKPRAMPTAEVAYEVTGTGTAEISYLARSEDGTATVEKGVTLPWKKSVQAPLGKAPTVAVVLDEKGGQATCTLAIRGRHVQRATAMGEFGRTTCTGELPSGDGEG